MKFVLKVIIKICKFFIKIFLLVLLWVIKNLRLCDGF